MIRKLLIIAVVMFVVTGMLFAQSSILSSNAFNIFRNNLDAAFDASETETGPVFSELTDIYLFGGLTNWFGIDTDANSADYFRVGYFQPGALPFSLLLNLDIDIVASSRSNGVTQNTATVPVVSGTTTTNYSYTTLSSNAARNMLESIYLYGSLSFLTRLANMNIGVRPTINYQNNVSGAAINTWVDANTTSTNTYYYNAAGAGVEPQQTTDYIRTITQNDPDTAFTVYLNLPLFTFLGTTGFYGNLYTNFYTRDQSSTYSTEYTNAVQAGTINNVVFKNDVTDVTGYMQVGLNTLFTLASIIAGGNSDDRFELGLNASATFGTPGNYSSVYKEQNIDFAGGEAPYTITADNQNTTINETRTGRFLWNGSVTGQQYFYFNPVPEIQFGLAPSLSLNAYTSGTSLYTTQNVQVDQTDGNLNGSYTDAADTITTTTTTYTGNDDGDTLNINTSVVLPAALQFKVANLPFSFLLANSVSMTNSIYAITNKATVTNTQVDVTDGTGTVISTTRTTMAAETTTSSVTSSWSFGNNFNIALLFDLPADITLSVTLNGQDLLDFSDVVAELIIPIKPNAAANKPVAPDSNKPVAPDSNKPVTPDNNMPVTPDGN